MEATHLKLTHLSLASKGGYEVLYKSTEHPNKEITLQGSGAPLMLGCRRPATKASGHD